MTVEMRNGSPVTQMAIVTGDLVNLSGNLPDESWAPIDLEIVAHHLSHINRYSGGSLRPYTVAEHSIHVAYIMEQHLLKVHDDHAVLAMLLHDAHEMLLGDITRPVKNLLRSNGAGDALDNLEKKLMRAMYVHLFGAVRGEDLYARSQSRVAVTIDRWICPAEQSVLKHRIPDCFTESFTWWQKEAGFRVWQWGKYKMTPEQIKNEWLQKVREWLDRCQSSNA